MKWKDCHLTYCLNIHPGDDLESVIEAIHGPVTEVKKRICPNRHFGLGLRLSAEAARELEPEADEFRAELGALGMYVFTINGFPYGRFHGAPVKKDVYAPDWTRVERVKYTKQLIRILARILPDGLTGSISTVPIGYGGEVEELAIDNLLDVADCCVRTENVMGRCVKVALEPEPDCLLSTTDDVLRFWPRLRDRGTEAQMRHLGVCMDTCHVACEFESPAGAIKRLEGAGIQVPKIQISAAPEVRQDEAPLQMLSGFDEDVYLHQTRVNDGTAIRRYSDLPDALEEHPEGQWRVHFHVPLHYAAGHRLGSTGEKLNDEFWRRATGPGRHLEIETYSFDVLPGGGGDVVESVCKEFKWVMEQAG